MSVNIITEPPFKSISKHTMFGKRAYNEDRYIILPKENISHIDPKTKQYVKSGEALLLAIFDGHGTSDVAEYLTKYIKNIIASTKFLYSTINKNYVINSCNKLNRYIKKNVQSSVHSGSTAICIAYYSINNAKYISVMNIGDCRAVLCRNNIGIPLTKDHKPHYPEETSRILSIAGNEKIKFDGYDWRICNMSVSRAFGDFDAHPYITCYPDTYRYHIKDIDKFIVIGCDGLWDCCSNQDVVNFVLYHSYDNTTNTFINTNISEQLAQYAIASGSVDNITVIVLFL
jgi:serine/threonine protein phosphatase PrpC